MNQTPIRGRSLLLPFLGLVLGLASCAVRPADPPSPLELAGMRATTIVIAPFNIALPLPVELKSSTRLVSDALVEHLERHGKKPHLLDTGIGKTLWIESISEIRNSGGARNFESAVRVFAHKVRDRVDFDAIIIPSLYIQNAAVGPKSVRWDGARQPIEFRGHARQEIEMPPATTVRAASLLVYVLDAEGKTIHTKRTGLELIQHM